MVVLMHLHCVDLDIFLQTTHLRTGLCAAVHSPLRSFSSFSSVSTSSAVANSASASAWSFSAATSSAWSFPAAAVSTTLSGDGDGRNDDAARYS